MAAPAPPDTPTTAHPSDNGLSTAANQNSLTKVTEDNALPTLEITDTSPTSPPPMTRNSSTAVGSARRASVSVVAAAAFKRRMTLMTAHSSLLGPKPVAGDGGFDENAEIEGVENVSLSGLGMTPEVVVNRPQREALITRDDVEMTFEAMSRGGKKVKREDTRAFVQHFFALLHGENISVANTTAPNTTTTTASASATKNAQNPNPITTTATSAGGGGGGGASGGGAGGMSGGADKGGGMSGGAGAGAKPDSVVRAKAMKLATTGKEEITRERLMSLLLNKQHTNMPFDEAFQWFEPHGESSSSNPTLNKEDLRRIAAAMSPYGMVHKGDVAALLAAFDVDKDGLIGLEDFKQMCV
ncbi:hypothetical protein DFJ77DRAFT_93203 [Powellomyces hirtus]|nr:hypothetical protein DFJ77DRAFT_93203 [Powellomyces hirtus]